MEGVFSRNTAVVLAVLVLYHWGAHIGASATTCSDVTTNIQPCVSTLNRKSNAATSDCCNGLLTVVNMDPQMGGSQHLPMPPVQSMVMNMPAWTWNIKIQVDVFTSIQNQYNVTL